MITPYQQQKLDQLQNELNAQRGITKPLQVVGEDNGYAFTEVKGVTVILIKRSSSKPYGGYILPAVMTYKETGQRPNTSLDAAVWADRHFEAQSGVTVLQRGHRGPIVKISWRCDNDSCPCRSDVGTTALARRNGGALQ